MIKSVKRKMNLAPKKIAYLGAALLLVASLSFLLNIYGRIAYKRTLYDLVIAPKLAQLTNPMQQSSGEPASTEFGLVIPKIQVNVPVVADVAADIERIYYAKLRGGVAHQAATSKPDQRGNTVIFGHSSAIPGLQPTNYANTFVLLDKLKKGDDITLYYKTNSYRYQVTETKKVSPEMLDILNQTEESRLTIFTCWPPGSDLKRYVVVAKLVGT